MIRNLREFVKKTWGHENYDLVETFTMLHAGWEMDEEVAMIKLDSYIFAIGTNHGAPCILTKTDLLIKASEYAKALEDTLRAMAKIS